MSDPIETDSLQAFVAAPATLQREVETVHSEQTPTLSWSIQRYRGRVYIHTYDRFGSVSINFTPDLADRIAELIRRQTAAIRAGQTSNPGEQAA